MERSAEELAKAVAEEAGKPRWEPYVDALIRLKGADVQTAFLACAEFGGFSRFRSGRRVSRWIGCTASGDSSGEGRRQGKIAKEGNSRSSHVQPPPDAHAARGAEGAARHAP